MSSFSPWGGLGGPGEACVKCGGKETMLGAHAPIRGASPKTTKSRSYRAAQCITPSLFLLSACLLVIEIL